jgi:hypothetical protein
MVFGLGRCCTGPFGLAALSPLARDQRICVKLLHESARSSEHESSYRSRLEIDGCSFTTQLLKTGEVVTMGTLVKA